MTESPLRLVFAGTPDFGASLLAALAGAGDRGFEIVGVLSQPARPKGRGLKLAPSPVMEVAARLMIPIATPERWDEETRLWLGERRPDLLVTAAYGLILPIEAIAASRLGAINVHASILPRWRGAAPVQRAIEAGDATTGITIFCIEEGVDTGPILVTAPVAIEEGENSARLLGRLAELAQRILPDAILDYASGRITPSPQPAAGATRARRIRREEGVLSWDAAAATVVRKWRAYQPWPGVSIGGIKLLEIGVAEGAGAPGRILSRAPLVVACGEGALRLDRLQAAGGRPITGADWANGRRLAVGEMMP